MGTTWRAIVEAGFIIAFLFCSHLLMGELEHAGMGQSRGFVWAIRDVVREANLILAVIAALARRTSMKERSFSRYD